MSVTTTANPVHSTIAQVLVDYDLHHSGTSEDQVDTELNSRSQTEEESTINPEGWPSNFRRMPHHRPINRNLDPEQRPRGSNRAENVIIFLMMNGVGVNAAIVQTWRATISRWTGWNIQHKIGGEI